MLHTSKTAARCMRHSSILDHHGSCLRAIHPLSGNGGFMGSQGSVRLIPCGGCGLSRILLFSFLHSFKGFSSVTCVLSFFSFSLTVVTGIDGCS